MHVNKNQTPNHWKLKYINNLQWTYWKSDFFCQKSGTNSRTWANL